MSDRFDLDHFMAIPRLSGLCLSPLGDRLAVGVSGPSPDGRTMRSAIWEIDPAGVRAPRRLTRSGPGESSAAFARDGSLLFTSARPDPDRPPDDKPDTEPMGLWSLPVGGGEACLLIAPGGGVGSFAVARSADVAVVRAPVHPGTAGLADDIARETLRTKAGVSAHLYESYPIRFWDHYLGPRQDHLLLLALDGATDEQPMPVDLTPDAGRALEETAFDVYRTLVKHGLERTAPHAASYTFEATGPDKNAFKKLASRFLGPEVLTVENFDTGAIRLPRQETN